ncbi:MAG: hypothetical protein MI802_24740, partial [Desulfobacterales bacterium]|nr:hypothetical protein [Desulfobacterales bacterium]
KAVVLICVAVICAPFLFAMPSWGTNVNVGFSRVDFLENQAGYDTDDEEINVSWGDEEDLSIIIYYDYNMNGVPSQWPWVDVENEASGAAGTAADAVAKEKSP